MQKRGFRAFLGAHFPLIGVLIAAFLVLFSSGTYTNWDAQVEFEAASSVVITGYPYLSSGLMINQPPLGFYLDAPVYALLGLSYLNGVAVVSAFGLGCIVLIYALATLLYGKNAGLVASALFAVLPWQVYMSRIYLIDVQYMFFSLLCLFFGVYAVRKNSGKYVLACGIFFALALLTKVFAVFVLAPLALLAYYGRSSGFRLSWRIALLFLAPSLILQLVWFGGFANQNFFGVYFNTDFIHPELIENPSLTFLPKVLVQSAGWFLFFAGLFSLALSVCYRRLLRGLVWLDVVCVGAIGVVLSLDLLLVFGFGLIVPYVSAFKYNYMTVPFFVLLAASLAAKVGLLIRFQSAKDWFAKLRWVIFGVGGVLLVACLVESMVFLMGWYGFVAFEVDSRGHYYPLNVYSGPAELFGVAHFAAWILIFLSLFVLFIFTGFQLVKRYHDKCA